jgi:hypothetical protein
MSGPLPATRDLSKPRYGKANPERVENPLWQRSVTDRWPAAAMRAHLGSPVDGDVRHDFSHSAYREERSGPYWSWQRLGRSSTPLLDGRILHVAGEHEDWYDADFCIYNDIIVEDPDGRVQFFLYPKDVLPPTDFHSATLLGGDIILIGSLGYADLRRAGETQVLRLDTDTMRVQRLSTTGEGPGWIARHTARRLSGTEILVSGGVVQTLHGSEANTGAFVLDLASTIWRRAVEGSIPSPHRADDLDEIEIELALADERFPLAVDSLKLLQFFERNAAGHWVCSRRIAIAGRDGAVLVVRPRQAFSRDMLFEGIDLYRRLQQVAWRADRA